MTVTIGGVTIPLRFSLNEFDLNCIHYFPQFLLPLSSGAKAKDILGRLPLHRSCDRRTPKCAVSCEVVSALLAAHPDGEAA
jgi:hypothetical protein